MLMLQVFVGDDRFTVDYELIVGVFPKVILKHIPHSSPAVIGLMNYEGTPIPVIDFSYLVERRFSRESLHSRIIILARQTPEHRQVIGLLAEGVTEMVNYEIADFKGSGLKLKQLPFINGIMSAEGGVIQHIEVEGLFNMLSDLFL